MVGYLGKEVEQMFRTLFLLACIGVLAIVGSVVYVIYEAIRHFI